MKRTGLRKARTFAIKSKFQTGINNKTDLTEEKNNCRNVGRTKTLHKTRINIVLAPTSSTIY